MNVKIYYKTKKDIKNKKRHVTKKTYTVKEARKICKYIGKDIKDIVEIGLLHFNGWRWFCHAILKRKEG